MGRQSHVRRNVWLTIVICLCCAGFAHCRTATAQVNELEQLATSIFDSDQGVFVQAEDGTVLVAQQEFRPVHPASVTKIATSLALLEQLGPDYRFETQFLASGPIVESRLAGDLVVRASGDPSFVFENAFVILNQLHSWGLREVMGDIRVEGPLVFNWKADPIGLRLKRALQGLDGTEAWTMLAKSSVPLRDVALRFAADRSEKSSSKFLIRNRSPPLITIIKALNGYSNNVFHLFSDRVGGPARVEALVRSHLPSTMRSEITITNAAGGGELNRLSPRAAVALLWAVRKQLRSLGKDLPSILPVNGLDVGTLKHRLAEVPYRGCIVGKTGTFGSVGASALVGLLHTSKYGDVAFAVLNKGLLVPEARRRQDLFLRGLIDASGAKPWDYVSEEEPIYNKAIVDLIEK
jgi:D-alanyl-D-alanine carboxypeptidase